MNLGKWLAGLVAAGTIVAPAWGADAAANAAPVAVFAVVDGSEISTQDYEAALAGAIRQKFYHRRAPAEQLTALRQEVADRLINRVLLLKEAQRRDLRPDPKKAQAKMEEFEQRFRGDPQWKENGAQALAMLSQAIAEQDQLAQLEATARVAPPPTEAELRAFYQLRPELVTQPERVRLSMILLKVEPSSPSAAWHEAGARAREIAGKLAAGADFSALARQHSGDESAKNGGDMGYRHLGSLPKEIETVIGKMAPGATSEPLTLLEGVAILRVTERKPAQVMPFEEARRNVAELWTRERGERQWRDLKATLRSGAQVTIVAEELRASVGSASASGGRPAR